MVCGPLIVSKLPHCYKVVLVVLFIIITCNWLYNHLAIGLTCCIRTLSGLHKASHHLQLIIPYIHMVSEPLIVSKLSHCYGMTLVVLFIVLQHSIDFLIPELVVPVHYNLVCPSPNSYLSPTVYALNIWFMNLWLSQSYHIVMKLS